MDTSIAVHHSPVSRKQEIRAILGLSVPMMVAQIAQVATGFVDTVMAGRVSTDALAAVSLGSSALITVMITLSGVIMALNPLMSHLFGRQQCSQIGVMARQGVWLALVLSVVGAGILCGLALYLPSLLQLADNVAWQVEWYLYGAALGLPGFLLFRVLHATTSSVNRTAPIMIVSMLALLLNIPLNYVFIHGLFGLPALGGAGCGWATAVVFWFSAVALTGHMAATRFYHQFDIFRRIEAPNILIHKQFFQLGLPIALSFFMEVSAFTFVAMLVARFGTVVVASHQVVINLSGLIYMIPQSLGAAAGVRVGQALGANRADLARFRSWTAVYTGIVCAVLTALLLLFGRHIIVAIYTVDPEVKKLATELLLFAALFQISDAIQTIASGALRGYKITRIPMVIHGISFWGIGLGLGVYLGLYLPPWPIFENYGALGIHGFWLALMISLIFAAICLLIYLQRICQQRTRFI